MELPTLTKNGVEQVLETYKYLQGKDLNEISSYMRINSNKNSKGEESVVLKIFAEPKEIEMKCGKMVKVKLSDLGGKIIYALLK